MVLMISQFFLIKKPNVWLLINSKKVNINLLTSINHNALNKKLILRLLRL